MRARFAALLALALLGPAFWMAQTGKAPRVFVYERQVVGHADGWIEAQAPRWEGRGVSVDAHLRWTELSWAELGWTIERSDLRAQLATAASTTNPWQARQNIEVTPRWRFHPQVARATLETLAPRVRVAAQDARFEPSFHRRLPSVPGLSLDIAATLARIATLAPGVAESLKLEFQPLVAATQLEDFPDVDLSQVLAEFETDFSRKRGPRVRNIVVAAGYLDGTVIAPGATLSFNRVVGKRNHARGFIDAPVIVNDALESGVGGGVCQVATTLHAAAVYGGLRVIERRSHSRPSGYAPLGLDATVIDGVVDLRVKNPYATPLYVRAYRPSRHVIRVQLLGTTAPGKVTHKYVVLSRNPFTRRVVERPEVNHGAFKKKQKGGYGYETLSTVTLEAHGGELSTYRYRSTYYPVPEILWVGPGTEAAALPPLPRGALPPGPAELPASEI